MLSELEYICQFDALYPGIDLWMKSKVFNNKEKTYWSIQICGKTQGLVIIDTHQGKLCHFSISNLYKGPQREDVKNFLYTQAIMEFKSMGIDEVFAHGTPEIVNVFTNTFSGWKIYADLNTNFGREGKDQLLKLNL